MSHFRGTMKVFVSHDVEVVIKDRLVSVKGNLGTLTFYLHDILHCKRVDDNIILIVCKKRRRVNSKSLLGTARSLLHSMLIGVTVGFTKKLQLVGVGYKAVIEDNIIVLTVGFSHVIKYRLPDGVTVSCPTPSDIVLTSTSKQLVGQAAADLRTIRPPGPFSGKGIRYIDEVLRTKEVKKK